MTLRFSNLVDFSKYFNALSSDSMAPASMRRRRHDEDANAANDGEAATADPAAVPARSERPRQREWDTERERFSALDHYKCVVHEGQRTPPVAASCERLLALFSPYSRPVSHRLSPSRTVSHRLSPSLTAVAARRAAACRSRCGTGCRPSCTLLSWATWSA